MKLIERFFLILALLLPFTLTAFASDPPFRFAVMSDSRAETLGVEGVNAVVFRPLLEQACRDSAAFILFPGDLVDGPFSTPDSLERQFASWKHLAQPVTSHIPIYAGMGNHDQRIRRIPGGERGDYLPLPGDSSGEAVFARNFSNPQNGPDSAGTDMPTYRGNVYSFDYGQGHFVMLNTNYYLKGKGKLAADQPGDLEGTLRPEQLLWLDNDLAEARARGQKYLFVVAHEPAFPNGGHAKDGMWWEGKRPEMNQQRDTFWKILGKHKVTAAFFGHEHNYSRMLVDKSVNPEYDYPVWQIVTGGAGAPLYPQEQTVPWAGAVQAFYSQHHFCLVEIENGEVWLRVLTPEGKQLERVRLNP